MIVEIGRGMAMGNRPPRMMAGRGGNLMSGRPRPNTSLMNRPQQVS